ncbi:hypothetical protein E1A91_D07G025700v1 [Gossypium mustelinum]|uniref:Oleosin n=1 Tax=Gossypium mustelinum TaxID=34275 RepID=A0A5D2U321_GOSMU|nr:hypothetical protein E1A91_D07G025700v1 [Gossypium mustelinum]
MSNDRNKRETITRRLNNSAPSPRQTAKFLTATTLGAMFLFLSGLTFTGTVIALVMATPLMVLFSPVVVPAGLAILLVTTRFLFSGGCGVAVITALSWVHNYVQGKHNTPPGAAGDLELHAFLGFSFVAD